jgi:hypothetical protein
LTLVILDLFESVLDLAAHLDLHTGVSLPVVGVGGSLVVIEPGHSLSSLIIKHKGLMMSYHGSNEGLERA